MQRTCKEVDSISISSNMIKRNCWNEFQTDIGKDFLNTVLELEEPVDVYLLEEFIEKEPIEESWKGHLSSNLGKIN